MDLNSTIQTIKTVAEQSNPILAGDYRRDGLWYCGKCDTPKECRVTFGDEELTVRCLCKCREQACAKETAQKLRDQQNERRKAWLGDFSAMTLDRDNGENPNMPFARRYIEKWDDIRDKNLSFVLCGPVGCGKTWVAASIANALIDGGHSVLMKTTGRIIDEDMTFEKQEVFLDKLTKFDLVILDDFGAERATEYSGQKIFDVADARIKAERPLLITTNLSAPQMQNPADLTKSRIYSRILGACAPISCKGGDLRKLAAADKLKAAEELFK